MRRRLLLAAILAASSFASTARALDDDPVARARAEYVAGTDFVKHAQWAEALAAFERSSKLHAHAVTTFDIAACERALGHYTRARATVRRALDENRQRPDELPESFLADATAMVQEIDGLLAHVMITIEPADSALAIDGRPLQSETASGALLLVAGIEPPGIGTVPPAPTLDVLIDPGAHVFTVSRAGYTNAVVRRTIDPGAHEKLLLEVAKLPATLHIASNASDAVVTVEGYDVGLAPVDVLRRAGSYKVVVKKKDFEPYEAQVALRPGEDVNLRASLVPLKHPLTEKWWFWTGVGVAIAGGAILTYALTRSDPAPQPYQGGSLNWVATPSAMRW